MSNKVYMFDPYHCHVSVTTARGLAEMINAKLSRVNGLIRRRSFCKEINCYLSREPFKIVEKRKLLSEFVIEKEQWKETRYKNFYVSNIGRFKYLKPDGTFEFRIPVHRNRLPRIKFNNKDRLCNRIVFETFKGKIKEGYCVSVANGIKYDIRLENLVLKSRKQIGTDYGRKAHKRTVIHIDTNGNMIDEYRTSKQAADNHFVSTDVVRDSCNDRHKKYLSLGYRAFVWSDEYYGSDSHGIV